MSHNLDINQYGQRNRLTTNENKKRFQECPKCGGKMGDMPGSRDAICPNCGYKDPCCE